MSALVHKALKSAEIAPQPERAILGAPGVGASLRSTMLEKERNNLKQLCQSETNHEIEEGREEDNEREGFVHAVTVRCKNWMCEDCKKQRGYALRMRLLAKAELFKEARLYTITVNREWFDTPQDAYDHVTQGGYIPRLFRLLGVKNWISVLEPQQETGDGWPHWHFLIDVSGLPGRWYRSDIKVASSTEPSNKDGWSFIPHFFDLNRVHSLLRKWGVGEQCYLTIRRGGFDSPEHAVNYITKYLVKMPKRGYPSWMLHRPRIRFVNSSRAVGAVVAEKDDIDFELPKEEEDEEQEQRKPARPPIERMAKCGMEQIFLQYSKRFDSMTFCGKANVIDPKIAMEKCPWATKVKNFDFPSLQQYVSWGFVNGAGVNQYLEVWEKITLQRIWRSSVAKRIQMAKSKWQDSSVSI